MHWQVIWQVLISIPLSIHDTDFAELMCRPLPTPSHCFETNDFISMTPPKPRIIHSIWEPRLHFPWPIWSRKQNGSKIRCLVDNDCVFPQTCCVNPILPGEKFCCTGFGHRRLIPAYVPLVITATQQPTTTTTINDK